ncbi:MAG: right-handed parallel beta-helix repeat-containing protein [Abitibacteriaceae bacterium]|nr:right-handed parallel beta-helix repeat-containing protein [Abditibacteriaceae bacterium]
MSKFKAIFVLLLAAMLFTGVCATAPPAHAIGYTVDDPGDAPDADHANGSCDVGNGHCSLRAALEQIAASGDATNSISFNLAGSGVHTIAIGGPLPVVSRTTSIDGTTQPGYAGTPLIELNGAGAGANSHGLIFIAGGNVIKGLAINRFGQSGIQLSTVGNNTVQSCMLGTNPAGATALGNGIGLFIFNSNNNTIGGPGAARNIISGNTSNGIFLLNDGSVPNSTSASNTITNNYVGVNAAGTAALANGANGIQLQSASSNTISQCVISGNTGDGIILLSGSNSTTINNNTIGLDASGANALGNGQNGVEISGSSQTLVGGATAARNIISANGNNGISVLTPANSPAAASNVIGGNIIGTNAAGTAARGNGNIGVFILNSASNRIGDVLDNTVTPATNANIISANLKQGIFILGATSSNNIVGSNTVGTAGAAGLGNGSDGVHIENAPNTTVRSALISGNAANGILILGSSASGALIENNTIGTNAAGTAALGNGNDGIQVNGAPTAQIGGTNFSGASPASLGNTIGGNAKNGIFIFGAGANGTRIERNTIGTNTAGTATVGNSNNGILIVQSSNNSIGGTASTVNNTLVSPANIVANNAQEGVFVVDGVSNSILGNSIFANGGLGINLGGGPPLPNDAGDVDTGPNNLQNYPVFDSAITTVANNTTTVKGTLNSTPNTPFRIEFYSNTAADASGFGEGQSLLGSQTVATDGSGNATITATFATSVLPPGRFLSATATDPNNNTSEFSADIKAIVDTTAPAVAVTDPANNSQITTLTQIGGTANDNAGGSGLAPNAVTVSIQRTVDNHFWTGADWSSTTRVLLPVSFDPPSGNWQKTTGLPTPTVQDGSYIIQAHAIDRAGNAADSTPVTATPLPPAPAVTGFSPTSGPIGTTVIITGNNLGSTTGVSFNGTLASFTVDSPSQITTTVPLNATTGPISVITRGGTVATTTFTVTPSPSPTPGPTATPVPGATPTPVPGATPTPTGPTPIPTATPGPTPTPTPPPIPALALTLSVSSINENAGDNAAIATVTRNTATNTALTVTLKNSDPNQVSVPNTVIIPAGATSTSFTIGAVSNGIADANHNVTLIASAPGLISSTVTLLVRNTDVPTLSLTIFPDRFDEGAGPNAAVGIVSRNTPTGTPLVVTLNSSNPRKARVPQTVTIPANAKSVSFPIAAVDNNVADGPQRVTITAGVRGFTPASADITVLDNEPGSSLSISGRCTVVTPTNLDPNLRIGVAGVTVSLFQSGVLRDVVFTNASGAYNFTGLPAGTYTVIPSKLFYLFTPLSRTVTLNKTNAVNADFTGVPRGQISGRVTKRQPNGTFGGVIGVVIVARNTQKQTTVAVRTDTNGRFLFDRLPLGTYILQPILPHIYFAPRNRATTLTPMNLQVANANFLVAGTDTIAPTITIAPLQGTAGPTQVTGTAQDRGGAGVASITLLIARFTSAGATTPTAFYNFNTQAFVPTYSPNAAESLVLGTNTWSSRTLPTLAPGFYGLRATATDFAGNVGRSNFVRFNILAPTHGATIGSATGDQTSPVALSTGAAQAATNSVQLKFLAALDADSASDAAHYTVSVNGQAVTVESASYNAGAHSVVLGLAIGSLQNGDHVVVAWDGLQDAKGQSGDGQTGLLTAK